MRRSVTERVLCRLWSGIHLMDASLCLYIVALLVWMDGVGARIYYQLVYIPEVLHLLLPFRVFLDFLLLPGLPSETFTGTRPYSL